MYFDAGEARRSWMKWRLFAYNVDENDGDDEVDIDDGSDFNDGNDDGGGDGVDFGVPASKDSCLEVLFVDVVGGTNLLESVEDDDVGVPASKDNCLEVLFVVVVEGTNLLLFESEFSHLSKSPPLFFLLLGVRRRFVGMVSSFFGIKWLIKWKNDTYRLGGNFDICKGQKIHRQRF